MGFVVGCGFEGFEDRVDFGFEFFLYMLVFEGVVEEGVQCDGCGVGIGDYCGVDCVSIEF